MLKYDGIQYLEQSNVSQFTQKFTFDARRIDLIWARIIPSHLMFHDSLSVHSPEILRHDGAKCIDKSDVSKFSKKNLLLEHYGPKLAKNDTSCIKYSGVF